MSNLRLQLADARAALRNAKDNHDMVKAQAEQQAIDHGFAGGKNTEERSRSLTIALIDDRRYQEVLSRLRNAEHQVDHIQAMLDNADDDRRAYEWSIRAALCDALGKAGSDDRAAFDQTADNATDTLAFPIPNDWY